MGKNKAVGFGTFQGVFLPSILSILGVIMYLRMGWVVGNVGLFGTIAIVSISFFIALLTGLSISGAVTNIKVRGGGAYYILSRSLGLEAGAALGIPLFLALVLKISLYIMGFSESFYDLFPQFNPALIGIVTLIVLTFISMVSANLAIKMQLVIFIVIIVSLVSIFAGSVPSEGFNPVGTVLPDAGFWTVFAVFFPAATGFSSGIGMSGDLKDPSKSIPNGILAAIAIGYLVYILVAVFLYFTVKTAVFKTNPGILVQMALWKRVVVMGIWGATLSGALGSILAAPRILQALARDGLMPKFLAKGYGAQNNPRNATLLSFIIICICIFTSNLNDIAPILSMFFLITYGMLNLSTGVESLIGNPSWRPTFKVHSSLSMLGAFGCFSVMLLINSGAAIIAILVVFSIYFFMLKKNKDSSLNDIRRSILAYIAKNCIYAIGKISNSAKCWNPNLLVLSGSLSGRWNLIDIANNISRGKGFLTVSSIVPNHDQDEIKSNKQISQQKLRGFLDKKGVSSLVEVFSHNNIRQGAQEFIQHYGIGSLKPNTVILGRSDNEDEFTKFIDLIRSIYQSNKNLLIVMDPVGKDIIREKKEIIDVWWWGEGHEKQNSALSLAIGYMLRLSKKWNNASLRLQVIIDSEDEINEKKEHLEDLLISARLDVELVIHLPETTNYFKLISMVAKESDLSLIGIRPPLFDEPDEDYAVYYEGMLYSTEDIPNAVLVMAGEEIAFNMIFVD